MNLCLSNAKVTYYDDFVENDIAEKIFTTIEELMSSENIKRVKDNNLEYKLKRKTMVFIDKSIKDNYVIPKIWGDDVSVYEFIPEMMEMKEKIENITNYQFNICLVNYYSTGKNNIGWHSDNEEKGDIECIASVSLGASREFSFRNKGEKETLKSIQLNNGSLLIMDLGCQNHYEHCLMQNKDIKESRVNLTFRKFKFEQYSK